MTLLIDTNIIIDYLADREPFANHAERLLALCGEGQTAGLLTANAVTDIYYILRKAAGHGPVIESLKVLFTVLNIAPIDRTDLLTAMDTDMPDFEDALVVQCAKRAKADYIITRNIRDFRRSVVPPLTPEDFLSRFYS